MKRVLITFVTLSFLVAGCSNDSPVIEKNDKQPQAVRIKQTSETKIQNWNIMVNRHPGTYSNDQVYVIEAQYLGESPASVVMSYRVGTKEQQLEKKKRPEQTVKLTKIIPHEKIILDDLSLPLDTPISIGITYTVGKDNNSGEEIYTIAPLD